MMKKFNGFQSKKEFDEYKDFVNNNPMLDLLIEEKNVPKEEAYSYLSVFYYLKRLNNEGDKQ